MAGMPLVSTPVDHQHAALQAVAGAELPRDMPCFRDPDNLIYGKAEAGGAPPRGYELKSHPPGGDGGPWGHARPPPPPPQPRLPPPLARAAPRIPLLGATR